MDVQREKDRGEIERLQNLANVLEERASKLEATQVSDASQISQVTDN